MLHIGCTNWGWRMGDCLVIGYLVGRFLIVFGWVHLFPCNVGVVLQRLIDQV